MSAFNILLALTISTTVGNAAYLRLIEAGTVDGTGKRGPILMGNIEICPDITFPKFTIECIPHFSHLLPPTSAEFYLDKKLVRKDSDAPFLLTGNRGNETKPWLNHPQNFEIECRLSNGESAFAMVSFDCETGASLVEPAPRPLPIMVSSVKSKSEAPNEPAVCVTIPATEYDYKSGAWEQHGSAMAYKYDDSSRSIDRSGSSKLLFRFKAPETSRYAFTIDWKTAGKADHNDVWVDFPIGGWQLKRRDSTKRVRGWIKAYQNANGRAVAAYSVDFRPHAISTGKILKKGQTYVVKLGGRSTKVKVFNIIMFPCEGDKCNISGYWNNGVRKCSA